VSSLISWLLFGFEPRPRLADTKVETRGSRGYWDAEERSQELLRSWLSVEQREEYDHHGFFEVVGCDTRNHYLIYRGRVFNIQELNADGEIARSWCLTAESVATGDVNLAQKIALESFETKALRIASRSAASNWHRPPRSPYS
jgi:hypothetical protein